MAERGTPKDVAVTAADKLRALHEAADPAAPGWWLRFPRAVVDQHDARAEIFRVLPELITVVEAATAFDQAEAETDQEWKAEWQLSQALKNLDRALETGGEG